MKKKYFTISLCLLLLLGVVLSVVLFTAKAKEEKINRFDDELVFNSEKNDGIKLNMRRANTASSNTYTITATVEPDDVVNKKLTWQLNWASSVSLKISSYVTMEVAEDTLSATLTYIKNFDTQIILTVKSQATTSVKATCALDCYKRVSSVDLDLMDGSVVPTVNENSSLINYNFNSGNLGSNRLGTICVSNYELTGSHEGDEISVYESLGFSNEFCDVLEELEISFNNGEYELNNIYIEDEMAMKVTFEEMSLYQLIYFFLECNDDEMAKFMDNVVTIFEKNDIFVYSYTIRNETAREAGKIISYSNSYFIGGFSYFKNYYYTVKSISLNTSAIIF